MVSQAEHYTTPFALKQADSHHLWRSPVAPRPLGLASRATAVAAGLLADRLLGEPPAWAHPVSHFGSLMQSVEQLLYRDRRSAGVLYTVWGAAGAASAAWVGERWVRQMAGIAAGKLAGSAGTRVAMRAASWTALAATTWVVVAGKALGEAALRVMDPLQKGDLVEARSALPALVGRDPSQLGSGEISRAAVESVGENTVDALVAPALWATLGGPPAALAYRAVNTMDAMVGNRSTRYRHFGWASARADDLAGWLPARLTALLVAQSRLGQARAVLQAVRTEAPSHPSPNAGVAEAAFAAALGVRLGGTNVYPWGPDARPSLGRGEPPSPVHIEAAVRLSRDCAFLLGLLLCTPAAWKAARKVRPARRIGWRPPTRSAE